MELETEEPVSVQWPMADPDSESAQSAPRRWWRGFCGSLAVGAVVLAVFVLGAQLVALFTDAPGPGAWYVLGHLFAAAIAVIAQRVADTRRGQSAALAGFVVVVDLLLVLIFFWWL